MRYIAIKRGGRRVSLTEHPIADQYAIPTKLPIITRRLSPLETIICEFLNDAQREKDRHQDLQGMEYKLAEPDPWMIAIGYLMWQGIIQGMTWDGVKWTIRYAIAKLGILGLAPTGSRLIIFGARLREKVRRIRASPGSVDVVNSRQSTSKTEIGFFWAEYATDGQKLREMFAGLRRIHEHTAEAEARNALEVPPSHDS